MNKTGESKSIAVAVKRHIRELYKQPLYRCPVLKTIFLQDGREWVKIGQDYDKINFITEARQIEDYYTGNGVHGTQAFCHKDFLEEVEREENPDTIYIFKALVPTRKNHWLDDDEGYVYAKYVLLDEKNTNECIRELDILKLPYEYAKINMTSDFYYSDCVSFKFCENRIHNETSYRPYNKDFSENLKINKMIVHWLRFFEKKTYENPNEIITYNSKTIDNLYVEDNKEENKPIKKKGKFYSIENNKIREMNNEEIENIY